MTTGPQFPPRDRLFALIASIPGSGTFDWCTPTRALLDEIEAPTPVSPPPATDRAGLRDRVAEALMRWAEGNNDPQYARMRRSETVRANAYSRADAVLSVLPPGGRAAEQVLVIEALYEARRPGLGGMTEAEAVAHMADTVLRRLAAGERDEQQAQQGGAETLPPPEGPEYTPCACGHIEPEHRRQRPGWTREACYLCPCVDYAPVVQQPDPPETGEEPSPEETVRGHVLALHQIGEQLAGIESWMWAHLADARDAAATPVAASTPRANEDDGTVAETGDACTCGSAGDAFVPAGHYADCPCPEARQQHDPAAPVAGQPPADTGEEAQS